MTKSESAPRQVANISLLSEPERKIINWVKRQGKSTLEAIAKEISANIDTTKTILVKLELLGFLKKSLVAGELYYQVVAESQKSRLISAGFFKKIEKISFATLIFLTLLTAALLTPFAFSSIYLDILRERAFNFYQILQEDIYKQITGYTALSFVILEMILTARKRGRGWFVEIRIPGSMQLWRSLHIFLGVALVGIILIHTVGAKGLNFNAIFLWIFFGVILSALVGIVAEVGILESPRKYFGGISVIPKINKGKLIRMLRNLWLLTHIFLVSVFLVMLGFHIFLAYYYQ